MRNAQQQESESLAMDLERTKKKLVEVEKYLNDKVRDEDTPTYSSDEDGDLAQSILQNVN